MLYYIHFWGAKLLIYFEIAKDYIIFSSKFYVFCFFSVPLQPKCL